MNVLWVLGPLLIAAWHVATRSASWRVEALGLAAFPLVAAAVARVSVPESPEFLAARAAPPPQRESEVYGIVGHLDPDVAAADAVAPAEPLEAPPRSPLAIVARASAAACPADPQLGLRVGVVLRTCLFRGRAVEARRAELCAAEPCGRAGLLRRGLPHEARGYGARDGPVLLFSWREPRARRP